MHPSLVSSATTASLWLPRSALELLHQLLSAQSTTTAATTTQATATAAVTVAAVAVAAGAVAAVAAGVAGGKAMTPAIARATAGEKEIVAAAVAVAVVESIGKLEGDCFALDWLAGS